MHSEKEIVAIILAAGTSSRLQKEGVAIPKPLLPIQGEEETLLSKTVKNCSGICQVLVVLGHKAPEIARYCRNLNVLYCLNEYFLKGQTSSLKAGIRNLPETAKAFLIYPVDHPKIQKNTVEKIIEAYYSSGRSIILPVYQGHGGHPLLVSTKLKNDFLSLSDDEPASTVIHHDTDRILRVEVDDPGILKDVDTLPDYQALK